MTLYKNPKEPIYKEAVFSLEEELLIGEAESKDEFMFSQVIDVDVDYEGRIYILDSREAHIKVFDKKGVMLYSAIGKRKIISIITMENFTVLFPLFIKTF